MQRPYTLEKETDMSNTKNLFRPSEYFKPTSVAEAVKLLDEYGEKCQLIAGGTDLLTEKDPQVEVLIDITSLGLDYIRSDSQGVRIGATTTFARIEVSPVLCESSYNVLAQAAHEMGTPQIRNMATIGGNICSALPSADSAPALLVLAATLDIAGPNGERSMDIADFFRGVRKNALDRGELLTKIQLPVHPARTGTAFVKRGRVATADLAIVNVAVRLTLAADNTCQDVRIALGAVAPTPLRAKEAEVMLRGEELQDELLRKVAAHAAKETKPINDVRSSAEYRRTLSCVLVERALKEATAGLFVGSLD
ncbi:Carbon monoxide dehydrogenase medium chain [subsurface metagenome]